MNWLDLFDDDAEADRKYARERARVMLSDLCEDDDAVIAPYVGMMPEESHKEDGSPLDFGKPHNAHASEDLSFLVSVLDSQIDRAWERMLREGAPFETMAIR